MSVTRNTLSLLIGSVAQKAIAFAYFALIARFSGVADTGKYFFALSWVLIFSIVTDLGLTSVLIREVAKKPSETARYLGQVITMKLPLVVLAGITAIGGAYLTGVRGLTLGLISFGALVLALDAVSLTFYGVLRGHHLLKYESLGLVIGQSLTLVIGAIVLMTRLPMILLMPALVVGSFWNACASIFFVWRRLGIAPRFNFDRAFAWSLAKTALPFALAGGFVKIYTNVDVVLLNRFGGDVAAGLYSVPYKLTFAFQFIPMAFTAALYPAMSHAFVADKQRLGNLFAKAQAYLMLIVAPIVAGMVALAPELVRLVYGRAFDASALPLQILIPVLVFIFLDFPVGSMLNACDHQVTQTKLMGMATAVSVVINLTLIPTYGVMAAVAASLCSHAILYFGGLIAVGRFLKWPVAVFASSAARTIMAALIMALVVIFTKAHLSLVATIVLGGVTYPILVLVLRAFSIAEARSLLGRALKRAI